MPTFIKRLGTFLIVGFTSCVGYFLALSASVEIFGFGTLFSVLIAFLTGSLVSYIGNSFLTFTTTMSPKTAIRFGMVALMGLAANQAIAFGLDRVGAHYLVIGAVIYTVMPVLNFTAHHFFTYNHGAA